MFKEGDFALFSIFELLTLCFEFVIIFSQNKGVITVENKILGVKESVKIIREDIKIAKKALNQAEEEYRKFASCDDCSAFYKEEVIRKRQHLDTLVQMKIKLEKYGKKLGHQVEERYNQDPFMSKEKVKDRLRNEFKKYGQLIIAFDFDYTVHNFHGEDYTYSFVTELLRGWRPYAKLIVFSASPETRYPYMKEYLDNKGIPFDVINDEVLERNYTRKIYYNVFLDDRAGLGETAEILFELLEEIKNGDVFCADVGDDYSMFGEVTEYEKRVINVLKAEGLSIDKIRKVLSEL